jgi:hypothetical protein
MKKTLRKLTLTRETLRSLETPVLPRVMGGGPKTTACNTNTTCGTMCDYTLSSCPDTCPSVAAC